MAPEPFLCQKVGKLGIIPNREPEKIDPEKSQPDVTLINRLLEPREQLINLT